MTGITIRPAAGTYTIRAKEAIIGETSRAIELLEGSHPPVIYIPREDIAMVFLDRSDMQTTCPYKGTASYFSVIIPEGRLENVVWSYETPKDGAEGIAKYLAFHPDVTVQRA
ncbi:MAG: DUF427 domain-containing protein [Rhodobacteraceae bacterium]|nr:DUF427 domain-containing protein [Paracoccaceae bacterium]